MEFVTPQLPSSESSVPFSSSNSLVLHPEWQHPSQQQVHPTAGDTGLGEEMWRVSLPKEEGMDSTYPERSGEPDCPYYMRTGLCGFGANCKFNHPPSRRLVLSGRSIGDYPERPGQTECQYYLKTGTCKFGPSCKYHHPRERAGTAGRAQLNILNLPLRLGEKDCAFYMRTGSCKFGSTCKFNHPPPMMSLPGSSMFPGPLTGTGNAPQLYPWPMPRPVYLQSPRLTGPSIAPMVLPPSPVSVPHWPYQVPIVTPEGQQPPLSASYIYGAAAPPQEPMAVSLIPPFVPSSATVRLPTPPSPSTSGFREETYPERPGEPECQFYMKTGECKYGSQCRYHHPKDRNAPPPSFFSHVGLPLRPGAPPCTFYSRFGYCKFGAACKFDHPMATATYPQVRIDAGQPHSYTADTMGVLAGSVAAPTTELSMDIYGQSYLRDVRREGVSTSTSLQAVDVHHGSSRG